MHFCVTYQTSVSLYLFTSRLILRCRQDARARFARLRSDVLVKLELLDNKHVQDVVWQLQRLVAGFAEFHGDTLCLLQGNSLFPIEVDLSRSAFQYTSASPVVQVCRMVYEIHFRAIMLEEGVRGIRIVLIPIMNKLHSKTISFTSYFFFVLHQCFMLCRLNNKFLIRYLHAG
jgi:hypothetical protein